VNKQEQLHQVLTSLSQEVPDVRGALLASRDGLPIVSTLGGAEAGRVAAMAATVVALATRVVDTIKLGSFEETVVQSDSGMFIVYNAGDLAVLSVLAQRGATLGLVHLEARRAAEAVDRMLTAYREELRTTPTASASPAGAAPSAPSAPAPTATSVPQTPSAPVAESDEAAYQPATA
jgi:predicted regulator of Ras-like GTPase activity (Roadblock/LC7/MglB family)